MNQKILKYFLVHSNHIQPTLPLGNISRFSESVDHIHFLIMEWRFSHHTSPKFPKPIFPNPLNDLSYQLWIFVDVAPSSKRDWGGSPKTRCSMYVVSLTLYSLQHREASSWEKRENKFVLVCRSFLSRLLSTILCVILTQTPQSLTYWISGRSRRHLNKKACQFQLVYSCSFLRKFHNPDPVEKLTGRNIHRARSLNLGTIWK